MKKSVLTLLLISCLSVIYAQEVQENKNSPILTFEERFIQNGEVVYDYGEIEEGNEGLSYFVFTNTGKEPLIMEKTSACCGTTITLPLHPILPGQKDTISVKHNTRRAHTIGKTVSVFSNAANSPTAIQIKGTVVAPKAESAP